MRPFKKNYRRLCAHHSFRLGNLLLSVVFGCLSMLKNVFENKNETFLITLGFKVKQDKIIFFCIN